MKDIRGFFGPYRWASNFHLKSVERHGIVFPCNENAFQYEKGIGTEDPENPKMLRFWTPVEVDGEQLEVYTPSEAKAAGRLLQCRPDWNLIRVPVMLEINMVKYSTFPERKWLLDTGDAYLEETNWWHDNFWGNCLGRGFNGCPHSDCYEPGENHLGKILMGIREAVR